MKSNKGIFRHSQSLLRRLAGVAVLALALAPQAAAQYGNNAYSFLELPTSSHAFALGGNGIAVIDDDVMLSDQNPGLLGPEIGKQVAFNYMMYLSSGNFAGFRYGMAAGDNAAWAAGIRYLNYGKMQGYDHTGVETETFSPQDIVIEGTYAHDIVAGWRGGINLKMVYSRYHTYTAFAMAADLGVNYYDEDHDLSFSFVIKNAGGQLKRFNEAYDRVPFDIQMGYMQGIGSSPFSIAITATNLTRWRLPYYKHSDKEGEEELTEKSNFGSNLFRHLIFGLQYQPSDKFYAALAYNYKTRTDMAAFQQSFFSGFSIGLGLKVKGFSAAVAFGQPHKAASSLMINLGYSFGELIDN